MAGRAADLNHGGIAPVRLASNTSEDFWLSAELLRDLGLDPQSFLAVTKRLINGLPPGE